MYTIQRKPEKRNRHHYCTAETHGNVRI